MTAEIAETRHPEAFAGRMLSLLNDGFLIFLVSLGHRTGLFDVLADLPASSSDEIARAAGLHERYVREWLSAMAAGRIVDYDPEAGTFHLPAERVPLLSRRGGKDNLAMFAQYAAEVGRVEDQVAEAFRTGRGVPYSAYHRMHELHREESVQTHDALLLQEIVPAASGLVEELEAGIEVLEVGCGAGHALNLLARRFPRSRFAGYDLSAEAISLARNEAAAHGVSNVRFDVRDVAEMTDHERYGLALALDAIHDQADPSTVLRAVYRALRSNGRLLAFDTGCSSDLGENVDHPLGAFLYSASTVYCMSVSLAYGGPGLGTMWGRETATRMLEEAGFADVTVHGLAGDPVHAVYLGRKLRPLR